MTGSPEPANDLTKPANAWLPWVVTAGLFIAMAGRLHMMGRVWWCDPGVEMDAATAAASQLESEAYLWSGDVNTRHNSQHLADPYTFSHVLHGVVFAWLFYWIKPLRRQSFAWRFSLGALIEAGWEILENTPLIINRYREATMALGYSGDSIGNSLGDLGSCMLGFIFATCLRWYWSVSLFIATELLMLLAIRDNLSLNVLMLLWPIDAVREWQTMSG